MGRIRRQQNVLRCRISRTRAGWEPDEEAQDREEERIKALVLSHVPSDGFCMVTGAVPYAAECARCIFPVPKFQTRLLTMPQEQAKGKGKAKPQHWHVGCVSQSQLQDLLSHYSSSNLESLPGWAASPNKPFLRHALRQHVRALNLSEERPAEAPKKAPQAAKKPSAAQKKPQTQTLTPAKAPAPAPVQTKASPPPKKEEAAGEEKQARVSEQAESKQMKREGEHKQQQMRRRGEMKTMEE